MVHEHMAPYNSSTTTPLQAVSTGEFHLTLARLGTAQKEQISSGQEPSRGSVGHSPATSVFDHVHSHQQDAQSLYVIHPGTDRKNLSV